MSDNTVAVLHVRRSVPTQPAWVDFFPEVDFDGIKPVSATSGAVLVVSRPSGLFAVLFGFGRYMLREGVIDERFGLRVVLNATDPSNLRSLDHKRLDAVPRHTREQLSKAGTLGQFALDVERDLLRGLTATPKDRTIGDRLTGSDSLTVVGPVTLAALPQLLDACAELSDMTDYRNVFPWVDNVAQVRDKRIRRRLDSALVAALKASSQKLWLAVPDIIPWDNVAGFAFKRSRTATLCDELSLDAYANESAALADMTVTRLDADIVRCVRADDGADMHRWSLRKCLVGDIELDGETFVVSDGEWFRIADDFLAQVNAEILSIPRRYTGIFPKFSGKSENTYNVRAARRSNGAFHLLDSKLVQYPPKGSVEICDLYDRSRVFIHMKRYGASGVLSHLFAQGAVSAELFFFDPGFRKAVWEKLPPDYQWGDPGSPPSPGQFEVCFGIICRSGKGLDLPFFSKVNLRKERQRLKLLGFEVSLAEIPS